MEEICNGGFDGEGYGRDGDGDHGWMPTTDVIPMVDAGDGGLAGRQILYLLSSQNMLIFTIKCFKI